jgi:SAM-dependent methyltransferase
VTGVDISPSAIALAEANAKQKGVACRFLVADVLGGLPELAETFEFAYDWSLLHHVFPLDRTRYAETVHRLLVQGGKYLSVCFSEKDAGSLFRLIEALAFMVEELHKPFLGYMFMPGAEQKEISKQAITHSNKTGSCFVPYSFESKPKK